MPTTTTTTKSTTMGTRIDDLPIELDQGDLQTRYVEQGDMAIRHARIPAGTDTAPVLVGLPGERCPSPTGGSCWRARSGCNTLMPPRRPPTPARCITGPQGTAPSSTKTLFLSRSDRWARCAGSANTQSRSWANNESPGRRARCRAEVRTRSRSRRSSWWSARSVPRTSVVPRCLEAGPSCLSQLAPKVVFEAMQQREWDLQ